jgi:hypothetical protein
MRIPDGVLPPEVANDPMVVTRKAGLTPWHCRLLVALEKIASYYDTIPAVNTTRRAQDA